MPPKEQAPQREEKKREHDAYGGIRCPKCNWHPRAQDRWMCSCRHVWNTFDTQGLCPACNFQWHDTQCLSCHQWSRHVDWYERKSPTLH